MTIQITHLDLPPPNKVAAPLPGLILAVRKGSLLIILDLAPDYPATKYRGRKGKRYLYPYYGHSLPLVPVDYEEYIRTTEKATFIWNVARQEFQQLIFRTRKKEPIMPTKVIASATKSATTSATLAKKNATMQPAKTTKGTRLPEFTVSLVSHYTPKDGHTRSIGFMKLTVENMLLWLEHNPHNRTVNWSHLSVLLDSFLAGMNDREGWIPEANLYIMDYLNAVADGQHRPIAFTLAYGNRSQVERLLTLIASWPTSGYHLPDAGIDPVKPLPVPITDWQLSKKDAPEGEYIPVLLGANPLVADKADTDQKKRTGADQLVRHTETGNMLAAYGMQGEELAQILRFMFLRVAPASVKASEDGAKYGSIRKGGNIHPDRYPVLAKKFQTYIDKAMSLVHEYTGWSKNACPIAHHQLIGNIALAVQGGVSAEKIQAFLSEWVKADGKFKGTAKVAFDAIQEKGSPLTPYHRAYLASRYLQAENPNPNCSSVEQLIKTLGGAEFEQVASNRLPGWDSTGCRDVITKSQQKKLDQAARAKAK